MEYRITEGKVTVIARSPVHDTTVVWPRVTGALQFAWDQPTATTLALELDMTAFDAGDRLKNHTLRSDYAVDAHPVAQFTLRTVTTSSSAPTRITGEAQGALTWQGRTAPLAISGHVAQVGNGLLLTGHSSLDIRTLGLRAPRILMLKVDDIVAIEVTLSATPAAK